MNRIEQAVKAVGGPKEAGKLLGVSWRNVYYWMEKGRLPYTEYTKATNYAEQLAAHPDAMFTKDWLLEKEHNANS